VDPFTNVNRGKLYPAISLRKAGEHVRANFGQTPFVYDINKHMRVRIDIRVHGIKQGTDLA
jgi:hypothetical protein